MMRVAGLRTHQKETRYNIYESFEIRACKFPTNAVRPKRAW